MSDSIKMSGTDEATSAEDMVADTSKNAPEKEKTFGIEEVSQRWKCPISSVERSIKNGLPMYKNSNDRWRIKESDLLVWEEQVEKRKLEKETEAKKIKRNNLIVYIVGGIIIGILGIVVLMTFTNVE